MGATEPLEVRLGSVPTQCAGHFQVIVANILAEVIVKLLDAAYDYPPLTEPLAPGGQLILSGIIEERSDIVLDAIERHGLQLVERKQEGDWIALIVRQNGMTYVGAGLDSASPLLCRK